MIMSLGLSLSTGGILIVVLRGRMKKIFQIISKFSYGFHPLLGSVLVQPPFHIFFDTISFQSFASNFKLLYTCSIEALTPTITNPAAPSVFGFFAVLPEFHSSFVAK